jgi:hypothetical protein
VIRRQFSHALGNGDSPGNADAEEAGQPGFFNPL